MLDSIATQLIRNTDTYRIKLIYLYTELNRRTSYGKQRKLQYRAKQRKAKECIHSNNPHGTCRSYTSPDNTAI